MGSPILQTELTIQEIYIYIAKQSEHAIAIFAITGTQL